MNRALKRLNVKGDISVPVLREAAVMGERALRQIEAHTVKSFRNIISKLYTFFFK